MTLAPHPRTVPWLSLWRKQRVRARVSLQGPQFGGSDLFCCYKWLPCFSTLLLNCTACPLRQVASKTELVLKAPEVCQQARSTGSRGYPGFFSSYLKQHNEWGVKNSASSSGTFQQDESFVVGIDCVTESFSYSGIRVTLCPHITIDTLHALYGLGPSVHSLLYSYLLHVGSCACVLPEGQNLHRTTRQRTKN